MAKLLFVLLLVAAVPAMAAPQPLEDAAEIPLEIYQADERYEAPAVLLWVPQERGVLEAERRVAEQLARAGMETWLADLFAAHFEPPSRSVLERLPPDDVANLIEYAHLETGKPVFLLASDRGAVPALRGARAWQEANPERAGVLGGIVLMHPILYVETPDPGVEPEILPIVRATNLPVFLIQPELSPWRWRLNETVPALREGGSDVFVLFVDGVRDRFFYRPDGEGHEHQQARKLPWMVGQGLRLLAAVDQDAGPRAAAPVPEQRTVARAGPEERTLKPYRGDPTPPPLVLPRLEGGEMDLADYQGQVVLLNFWASWCPPCVHEMPSMQRLQDTLAEEPFTILAANMAEDEATVRTFLDEKVDVDFPIVMDEKGAALQAWNVFAFPTTFVIDKAGRIRYALFGAIDWDQPAVVEQLRALANE
ncbi:TlpA family protein disulfide reductase [Ectothiorhodospiraceae bacterium 2226]|nr:TlpA family protein disulfide reductase [Ectothiorhodospiraceae bacterium 2226]